MPTLLEKMEANAAERLALPPGRKPAEELARFKNFLKVETHRLKILHRAGESGREICHARAALMDILLRALWDAALSTLSAQARKEFPPLALVAIGGYGRAELNPHSDIDFMFLHDGRLVAANRPLPHLAKLIDGILYPLWDIGLKVGHSVRSLDECALVANGDMQSKTSIIEARLVAGSAPLFEKFQKTAVAKCVDGHEEEYIAARIEDQAARRSKFGNSALMQEPNVKNGCGGLRDYQNLLWMAFFKYRTRSLAELERRELIVAAERKQLEAAYDFLLRVRNEMHYHLNRPADALLKSMQPAVALNLGYPDRSPSRRIEKFMRDVYTHLRNIHLITRTLEQRLALLPAATPQPRLTRLKNFIRKSSQPKRAPAVEVDGFKIEDGQIHATSNRIFRDQPRRLMRAFLHAQQRGLKLHPDLAQLIRNQVSLVDREFLQDEHVRETFLAILNQRGNVAWVLRAMHEVGLLGKYIPEFGKLTCLVQHEFYHQYAADEHTLVCLEKLDQIAEAKKPPFSNYTEIFQGLERPFVLYLALLLHDVGKADGHGAHADEGAKLALRVARRLQLDAATTHTLERLIEQHLLMARVAQRHDQDDPAVIRSFARQIESLEMLTLLTLLTFADSQGTSDKLWNDFKETLHWSLFRKTEAVLTGATEFLQAEDARRDGLRREVAKLLPEPLGEEELEAHFAALPPRYFLVHTAPEILDDVLLAHRFMRLLVSDVTNPLAPVVNWHNDPDRGGNVVKVCTWDRPGLFSKLAGSFSAAGLNILSAQIFTRADFVALDTFFVTHAGTGGLATREQRDKLEKLLDQVLGDGKVDLHALIKRQHTARPLYQANEGERIETHIAFDNEISENRTAIEIE
ncbi:MAG: [protein-PII] uridylyltransferase, partial [Verrucomicrobia bacterium]|nr:[protein-PII] uridylyltransferase [Verrucomicrobiota bacterium]